MKLIQSLVIITILISIFANVNAFETVSPLTTSVSKVNTREKMVTNKQLDCIKLQKIELADNPLVSSINVSNYKNKCIDKKLIISIVNNLENQLNNQGYITSKAYLPKQNIKSGILKVAIAIGKINTIIDKRVGMTSGIVNTAFIGQGSKVLDLQNLETSLEVINQAPSVKATFKIKPSVKESYSDIIVDVKQSFPLRLTIG